MEACVVFTDRGFFKLVKKEFEIKEKKKKKFLQTFRNICKNEKLNLKHLFVYDAPPFQSRIPTKLENILRKKYDNIKKMLDKRSWITFREGRCQKIFNENNTITFNQKGVNSLIVMDLMTILVDYSDIKNIILIASDSDFVPVEDDRNFFKLIILDNFEMSPSDPSGSLDDFLLEGIYG